MNERSHKDSPLFQTIWHVCRECHHIQQCIVVRGWNVCLKCLEENDRKFCGDRADALFAEFAKDNKPESCEHGVEHFTRDGEKWVRCPYCKEEAKL